MARPVALLLLVTVVLLGTACSHSSSEPQLDGKKNVGVDDEPAPLIVSSSAAGISVVYPRGWQATGEPLTSVTWPPQRLAIASYPLKQANPDPGCAPAPAFAAMPADGAFIYLMEYTAAPDAVGLIPRFGPRPAHFGLDERTLAAYECLGESYLIRFADRGRRFQVHVAFGDSADEKTRATALAILDSLVIGPLPDGGGMPTTNWKTLRRPLHLPAVSPGEACPRTPTERRAPLVGFTIGKGPVFPVLGFSEPAPGGLARLRDDIRRGGYYLHKTLWAISARYHGPVLIRGRRIDGPGALRFSGSRHELRVPAGPGKPDRPGRGWRYGPTATLIPRAGCYAFQIDGRGFSRVLVFEARR